MVANITIICLHNIVEVTYIYAHLLTTLWITHLRCAHLCVIMLIIYFFWGNIYKWLSGLNYTFGELIDG